ncbi:MAG: hypothetical protein IPN10_07255 [Saprospiraceae bacterium]|nr:hypothetical protein [Saprospiraceae bacterium]
MVKPSAKRMIVTYLVKKYKASVEQSVSIVNMSRSSWYYKSRLNDSEIVTKLEEMVENYPNRGFENYYPGSGGRHKMGMVPNIAVYRRWGWSAERRNVFIFLTQESLYNKWNAIMKHGVWTSW